MSVSQQILENMVAYWERNPTPSTPPIPFSVIKAGCAQKFGHAVAGAHHSPSTRQALDHITLAARKLPDIIAGLK